MGIHLTATFEYTAFRDIQTSGADISNELSLGLNAEIPITVYVPRNRSTHDQAVRLNVSLHIAAFTDNHIAGNGYVAVNMPVNADIAGAFHISFNSRFPSNDCLNVTYGIVDMFFHAAKHESFPFPVNVLSHEQYHIAKLILNRPPPQEVSQVRDAFHSLSPP